MFVGRWLDNGLQPGADARQKQRFSKSILHHRQGSAVSNTPSTSPEKADVVQSFGSLIPVRLGLAQEVRHQSVAALTRLLAHTIALRDLYKKSHWQTSGTTFFELHLLFDKHYGEQAQWMDALGERVQALGGMARALARDVAEESRLSRGPSGIESTPTQLLRLVEAHEFVLEEARPMARDAAARGDEGTNDLIVSQVIRGNEQQCWFVARHLGPAGGNEGRVDAR